MEESSTGRDESAVAELEKMAMLDAANIMDELTVGSDSSSMQTNVKFLFQVYNR